jgi:phospholipid/cholesterol/gamma-HCH transport system substrate-binding protein
MTPRNLRIRLGLFVIGAFLLFAILILLFGSLPTLFQRSTTYTVRFTDAPGLAPGAPVRRSGVRIGEVRAIDLDEEKGIVRVVVAIRKPYSIRRNEQATIVSGLLGSDSAIDFVPRPAEDGEAVNREAIEPGAELVGIKAATVGTLLRGASEVVPTTQETLADIRKSIQRLEKLAARVEKTVPLAEDTLRSYRDLARRAQQSIPELEKTNTQAQELIKSAQGVIPQVERTAEEYRLLAQDVRRAIPELMKTNKEIADLAKGITNVLPSVERTAEEIREFSADVRKLLPTARNAIEDVAATSRTATKLLEEFDVFWGKNRDTVQDALGNLNRTLSQVAKLMSDDNLNKINLTLTNLRAASESFPKIARDVADITEIGKTTIRNLNDVLKKLEKPLDDFQKAMADAQKVFADVQRITKPLGERADSITRNVDEALVSLNKTLGDVRALMQALDQANGTLKKFLTDPSLYNNIDAAVVTVLRMIPRFDRILKDFETFADKLARHPELIGAGGIIRPSDGLKNPPTPPLSTQPHGPAIMHTPNYQPKK